MIRNDLYAKYMGIDCRFWEIGDHYMLQTDYDEKLVANGFKNYNDKELKDKIYKEVILNDIESAFVVRTFCKYIGGIYAVENIYEDNVLLYPSTETHSQLGLHPYDERRALTSYDEFNKYAEEIWEERKPIEGFEVESIFYIKKCECPNNIIEWYVRKPLNLKKGSELWFVYDDETEEFKSIVRANENREIIFEQIVLPTFYDNNDGKITFVIDSNLKRFESFNTSIIYLLEKNIK